MNCITAEEFIARHVTIRNKSLFEKDVEVNCIVWATAIQGKIMLVIGGVGSKKQTGLMTMKKIALIGAGNIGSRHLRALANVNIPLDIYVVEPSKDAFELAMARFSQVENSREHSVKRLYAKDLPDEIDLAVIATSSGPRFGIIEELTAKRKIRNIVLEKFLFPEEEQFFKVKGLFDKKDIKAWVNTTRRAAPFYKKLKDYLADASYISMLETGGKWGLACNGIHILDFFSMLQGDGQDYTVDTSCLDNAVYDSKRQGYIEFNGSITFSSNKGVAIITCFSGTECPMTMTIHSDKGFFEILEGKDECICRLPKNNYEPYSCKMENKPTSVAMTNVYEDIINKGTCNLPVYDISMKLHLVFLRALLNKQNEITGNRNNTICPIT